MAYKRLASKIDWIKDLYVYKKEVKGNINKYNAIEQYSEISYFDAGDENEYNIKDEFEKHIIKSSFFGKESETTMLLQHGCDIIYMKLNSETLESEVSRWTRIGENIISRLVEDTSYKKKGEISTKAQTQYSTVYATGTNGTIPKVIVKEDYKSDPESPEVLNKKVSEIVSFPETDSNDGMLHAVDTLLFHTSNSVGDFMLGHAAYAYSIDNELIKINMHFDDGGKESEQFIIPSYRPVEDTNGEDFAIVYTRANYPDTVYAREFYTHTGNSIQIYRVDNGNTHVTFNNNGEVYLYEAVTEWANEYKKKKFKVTGSVDVPTSAMYFIINTDKYGIPQIANLPFLNSVFVTDLTGRYYYVHSSIEHVEINGKIIYEYLYDEYGIVNSQTYYGEETPIETCKYHKERIVDDDGNYIGTFIESMIDSNPLAKRSTEEYFYRAVVIKEGRIVQDYRALLKFSED